MPVLHGVRDVGSLDNVFNNDRGLVVLKGNITVMFLTVESNIPPRLSQRLEFLVEDICSHDRVNNEMTEASALILVLVDTGSKILKVR